MAIGPVGDVSRYLATPAATARSVPGFFLALAPNTRRYVPGFTGRVLRFAIPAGSSCRGRCWPGTAG